MKKYLFALALFLTSCSEESVYDSTGHLICKDEEACGSFRPKTLGTPTTNLLFSAMLKKTRLHYPDIQTEVEYGKFDGFVRDYFYLDGSLLTFQLDKNSDGKLRSELRFGPEEWDVSEDVNHLLKAKIRCFASKKLPKYTFIQIHGDEDFSLPLLRLTWEKKRAGKTNHLWAILMTSRDLKNKTYEWFDLGVRKDSLFDMTVSVKSNTITIKVDAQTKVFKDISYWYGIDNYYKAGLYLNDKKSKGETKVQFQSLEYLTN